LPLLAVLGDKVVGAEGAVRGCGVTSHQIRAIAYLVAAVVGVGLIVAADHYFGPWGAFGATCLFIAWVLALCPRGTG